MSANAVCDGSSAEEQRLGSKRRRTSGSILPSILPSIHYHKSISGEEFEEDLNATVLDTVERGYDASFENSATRALAHSYSWQSFWKLMLYIFGCSPWDLETWGLRLSREEREKTARLLGHLLPHPVWECRVDILRFVLQKTVGYRLKSDMEPLGPLAPGVARGLVKAGLSITRRADTALRMWKETNPGTNHNIAQLLEVISKTAEITNAPAQSAQVFILEPEDVIIVSEALDTLSQAILPPYTVDQYWDSFVRHHSFWPGDMAPYDVETVVRWDNLCAAEKENRRIYKEPNIPPGERDGNEELAYWKSSNCDSRVTKMMIWGRDDDDHDAHLDITDNDDLGGEWRF
ncbi:hypothetical protein F4818DRAFT_445553 [Hypoxylon cercidicola]|nr:hypothetical protein F4818DRAFT_445553 [Hypoxylon cercidicola]